MKEKEKGNFVKRLFRNKKRLVILATVLIAGFLIWRFIASRKSGKVETAEVKRGTVSEELILSGQINADEYVALTFPASGQIAWVGVKEGDKVKKGQALTKLDTVTLNTVFQQARATLRAAEATVQNIHDQVKDHSGDETYVQKDTRTTAEAAKDRAYEAYIAAEYNLRNSTLASPFSGIVTLVAHPFPGVNVLATETQVEIINPETIYFDVAADQSEVTSLKIGQKVNIVLDSYPEEEIKGEVIFISYTPKPGEAGTVYKIRVKFLDFDNNFEKFRLAMGGDAKFILNEKESVLYLPSKFVNSDTDGKYVNKGKAGNKVYITVGLEGEDLVEVSGENIKEGDIVYD